MDKKCFFYSRYIKYPFGFTVTWINHDPQAHTVISDDTVKSEIPLTAAVSRFMTLLIILLTLAAFIIITVKLIPNVYTE